MILGSFALFGAEALSQPSQPSQAGRRQFIQCQACHATTASTPAKIGPHLQGVVGRKAASVPGYAYSPALRDAGIVWTRPALDAFLKQPNATVPGNKMAFAGIPDATRRRELIDFLMTQQVSAGGIRE